MRYQSSEAVRLDASEKRRPLPSDSPSFEVVEGAGLDARVRAGVSAQFVARAKMVIVIAVALVALGMCRVAITSATVSVLQSNSTARSDIKTAQALNDDLKVERSVLSSNSRISRIATQNYGMVFSTSTESMSITSDQAAATDDDASSATSSDGTQTDGDVAQTDAEASATDSAA
ncbi:MAG: cell division protein FtsL [Atopobiaceae bacterium]|jgi:cell division protein FtsL|nr:cell division protein FtsL [Atopobiaceae bacterium]MCI2173393.1 cell division protein FtsL [Atopobiaceae bacterium]MCI2207388.1 cell division protein FtsL [Atopobiaceae bacterium]